MGGVIAGSITTRTTEGELDTIAITVNDGCNLACEHCYLPINKGGIRKLDLDLMRQIVENAKEIGTKRLAIVGMEPYLDKDSVEITTRTIQEARDKGLETSLITNGTQLSRLIETDKIILPDYIDVSLDGGRETYGLRRRNHTGAPANLDIILKGIYQVMSQGVSVTLLNTFRGDNTDLRSLDDMCYLIEEIDSEDRSGNFNGALFSPMIDAKRGSDYEIGIPKLYEILDLVSVSDSFRSQGDKARILLDPMNIQAISRRKLDERINKLGIESQIISIPEKILSSILRITHDGTALSPPDSVHVSTYSQYGIELGQPVNLLEVKRKLETQGRYQI